jgi:hypothetical protein
MLENPFQLSTLPQSFPPRKVDAVVASSIDRRRFGQQPFYNQSITDHHYGGLWLPPARKILNPS